MDQDRVEGTLREGQGKIKEEWGDATDDTSTEFEGKAEQLQGEGQQKWGDAKDTAGDWASNLGGGSDRSDDR